MSEDFPTGENSHFEKSFHISSADRYFVSAVFDANGPLEGKDKDFTNEYKAEKIPCDLSLSLSNKSGIVHQQSIGFLIPGYQTSGQRLGYELLYVDLDKTGDYQISIDNRKDLTYLGPTNPKLDIRISDATVETRLVVSAFISFGCIAVGIAALILTAMVFMARDDHA